MATKGKLFAIAGIVAVAVAGYVVLREKRPVAPPPTVASLSTHGAQKANADHYF